MTSFGLQEFRNSDISKILQENNPAKDELVKDQQPAYSTNGIETLSKAMLYESRKKSIGTAMGFQFLGGGLLYAEKYKLGGTMMALENGLIIGGMFISDPDTRTGMVIGGLILKAINSFFTIQAVNEYNDHLAYNMGLSESFNSKINVNKNYPFGNVNISGIEYGLLFNFGGELAINDKLRFGLNIGQESDGFGVDELFNVVGTSLKFVNGKTNHKFEYGLGAEYEFDYYYWYFMPSFGYRYEKKNSMLFKIGISGYLCHKWGGTVFLPLPYIAFGYSF